MTRKKTSTNPSRTAAAEKKSPQPRTEIAVEAATAEEGFKAFAAMVTSPSFAAMRVLRVGEQKTVADKLDLPILIRTLRDQARAVNTGDLAQAEGMLINQAVALQSLFARLVERGMAADLLDPYYEVHMRLALRAQAQCTRTLEVLASIKNPPVVIAKQANIAHQQQVNNGIPIGQASRTRETENSQNKLLETLPDERLDFGTPATTSGADSDLASVGAVNRAEVGNR
ncbi:MAG: hypothetical protein RKO66_18580 [Candidatus Contendobacter sp.]|nr:hypothetical protein [Candidatus Contendobacter sp.]